MRGAYYCCESASPSPAMQRRSQASRVDDITAHAKRFTSSLSKHEYGMPITLAKLRVPAFSSMRAFLGIKSGIPSSDGYATLS